MVIRQLTTQDIFAAVLAQVRKALERGQLVSLATGNTFAPLFPELDRVIRELQLQAGQPALTHLDEYLGLRPDDERSMAGQLRAACPVLRELADTGRFLAVPGSGDPEDLAGYRARVASLGGVGLQLLGIGSNGHIAFNEPGSTPDSRLRVVDLADSTRAPLRDIFGLEPPRQGVTAGVADILSARSIILVALGAGKAEPVRRMLKEPPDAGCPASFLGRHPDVTVFLDPPAASAL